MDKELQVNEKIKQLLNEATSGHVQETDRSKVMSVSDGEMQRFAELIVEECAKVILETPVKYTEIDIMHIIRDNVTQHFGIKYE